MPQQSNVNQGSSSTGAAGRASGGPGELVQDVKEVAGEAANRARKIAETRLSKPRSRAADTLSGLAKSLRATGEKLDETSGLDVDQYVERAADGIERVSDYMRQRELTDVVRDVEDFARREPGLFFGGAFVLGLVGSRFLKSSRGPRRSAPSASTSVAYRLPDPNNPRPSEEGTRANPSGAKMSDQPRWSSGAASGVPSMSEPPATNGPASSRPPKAPGKP